MNWEYDDFFYGDADIEAAELAEAGRRAYAAIKRSRALERAGRIQEAAEACPHGSGYPLDSLAAENASDPRKGEPHWRCCNCGSVLESLAAGSRVIHPCDLKRKEDA